MTDSNTADRVKQVAERTPEVFSDQLARIPALLLAGDGETAAKTALSVGADEMLIMNTADSGGKMLATLSTVARAYKVSANSRYSIWRFDASELPQIFSPVRASWQQGKRNVALKSQMITVKQFVKSENSPRQIVIHELFNHNWQATISGERLKPINVEGQQGFEWPAGKSGYLRITYHNGYWWGWSYLMLIVFCFSFIALIPWPQKKVEETS